MEPNSIQRERMIATLSMQFPGCDISKLLDNVEVTISKKTGRIRAIREKESGEQLFSLRTSDGRFLPTYEGGLRLLRSDYEGSRIVMNDDAAPFIAKGKSAFCKHVVKADQNIVPESEVLLIDKNNELLAVGTAQQPGYIITILNNGVAAKVKHSRE